MTAHAEDHRPERRRKVKVRVDADLLRNARDVLGARTDSEAVELAMTIALAFSEADTSPNMKRLSWARFKI